MSRADFTARQSADVETLREAAPCSCRWFRLPEPDGGAECDTDPACPRHGDTAEARAMADVFRCECGTDESREYAMRIVWATHAVTLCRACSWCAGCGLRVECTDGELCEACAEARDRQLEHTEQARDGLLDAMHDAARVRY